MKLERNATMKEEVINQLEAIFSGHNYPKWLANIVLVPKKDEKVRMCVDLRDLSNPSFKDDSCAPTLTSLLKIRLSTLYFPSWWASHYIYQSEWF